MTYIPKKLTNPGLRAIGNNFVDADTGVAYVGPYHENFGAKDAAPASSRKEN